MLQKIDIELFKENPQILFSQLPQKAEKEIENLLKYIVFKYNIKNINKVSDNKEKFKLFKENPIKVEKIVNYTREELHER